MKKLLITLLFIGGINVFADHHEEKKDFPEKVEEIKKAIKKEFDQKPEPEIKKIKEFKDERAEVVRQSPEVQSAILESQINASKIGGK